MGGIDSYRCEWYCGGRAGIDTVVSRIIGGCEGSCGDTFKHHDELRAERVRIEDERPVARKSGQECLMEDPDIVLR
jgi:hypothetical protein